MPGPGQDFSSIVWSVFTEPIFQGIVKGVLFEMTREGRPADLEDESVASFLERRLGSPHIGNNIVSAVMHGIYAGDIYQLSARSLLPKMWDQEGQHGSLSAALSFGLKKSAIFIAKKDAELLNEMSRKIDVTISDRIKTASVFTFKKGIAALSGALETSLRANPNVQFKTSDKVTSVEYNGESDGIKVCAPLSLCSCKS
jgi:oxygen-dependent protoporphyrinogen oxidase